MIEYKPPAIELLDIAKAYRIYPHPRDRFLERLFGGQRHSNHQALESISFTVARGEKIGVIGRNGSGKSTLLQLIVGTRRPSSGVVRRHGRIAALLELGAGFNPEFTGLQNVRLNLGILGGATQSRDEDRVRRIIEFADIGEFIDRPVKLYSSGMYLRLAFAVAIHVEADIIIIDEALAVGDFAFQARCLERLDRLAAEGRTIFFVSHDIAQVRRFCDRAIYLKAGRLIEIGDVGKVCDAYFTDVEIGATAPVAAAGLADQTPGELNPSEISATDFAAFEAAATGRSGSQSKGRLRAVKINGMVVEPAQIAFEENVEIEVVYEIVEPDADLVLAFYITDVAGQPILGSNTLYEGHPLRATAGEAQVRIAFPNRLRSGEYAVNIMLATFRAGQPTVYEDHVPIACRFASVADPRQPRWAMYSPDFLVTGEQP